MCYAVGGQIVGVGAGQQSRVDCVKLAGRKVDTWHARLHPKVRKLPFKDSVKVSLLGIVLDVSAFSKFSCFLSLFLHNPPPIAHLLCLSETLAVCASSVEKSNALVMGFEDPSAPCSADVVPRPCDTLLNSVFRFLRFAYHVPSILLVTCYPTMTSISSPFSTPRSAKNVSTPVLPTSVMT